MTEKVTIPMNLAKSYKVRRFRLGERVYLERFDSEALLLVADQDRLLTVNAAAADLFAAVRAFFGSTSFTVEEAAAWLTSRYALTPRQCRDKLRELLAFGLRHGLVCRAAAGTSPGALEHHDRL